MTTSTRPSQGADGHPPGPRLRALAFEMVGVQVDREHAPAGDVSGRALRTAEDHRQAPALGLQGAATVNGDAMVRNARFLAR
ncbi:hypothetical protein ACH40E_06965 [Streptomyces acidicola]|uniref:hypothetical protein n=1 Tax=Streptomyces acidicola TaxID=2596892 RepID=UPI0037980615